MVKELSKQQRKVLLLLAVAILLGAGRLGFRAFSRGTLEVHLVAPVTAPWPAPTIDGRGQGPTPPVLALAAGGTTTETNPAAMSSTEPEAAVDAEEKQGAPSTGGAVGEEPVGQLLDPNTATNEELQTIPGIGPVLAARIIEYRETVGKFRSIEDLLAVKGIGEKTLAKIRPYLEIKE